MDGGQSAAAANRQAVVTLAATAERIAVAVQHTVLLVDEAVLSSVGETLLVVGEQCSCTAGETAEGMIYADRALVVVEMELQDSHNRKQRSNL